MRTSISLTAAAMAFGIAGSALALPNQSVFDAAGLGPMGGWTLVGDTTGGNPEIFGTGGNGALSSGGLAEYELRLAQFGHIFGTSDTTHNGLSPIFDSASSSPGSTTSWAPATNPFLFYFQTKGCGVNCTDDGVIFSDGHEFADPLRQLDMAIYVQGGTYALFFDDGGPSGGPLGNPGCNVLGLCFDDDDYNDMVVTVRAAAVPEPGALAMLGVGLASLGLAMRRRRRNN